MRNLLRQTTEQWYDGVDNTIANRDYTTTREVSGRQTLRINAPGQGAITLHDVAARLTEWKWGAT